jgi:hypothetical protein
VNLEQAYAETGVPQPKPRRGRPEHALQVQLGRFCREYLATPHFFAAHDRSENSSGMQHMWEAARHVVAGWPDVEIALQGGRTVRVELKAPGNRPSSAQAAVMDRLSDLGHPTGWADSAVAFLALLREFGVPWRENADKKAAAIDAFLAQAAVARKAAKPKAARKARVATSARALRIGREFQRP